MRKVLALALVAGLFASCGTESASVGEAVSSDSTEVACDTTKCDSTAVVTPTEAVTVSDVTVTE
jgi:hypothetical protein